MTSENFDETANQNPENSSKDNSTQEQKDVFAVIDALNAENASLKEKLLRTLADMENLRKRTEREVNDMKIYGITNFAKEIITVADNLKRALLTLDGDSKSIIDEKLKSFVGGIELTDRDLEAKLNRFGIKKIDPIGEKFDPNLHQAMFEAPNASVASGFVCEVVQSGYKIGERVLRPALVGVAKTMEPAAKVNNS